MRVSQIVGKKTIDLNVDIGEGFLYDRELLSFASSANVCCGAHAGSDDLARETVAMCKLQRVRIGAHPGYPDRASMGRQSMESGQERIYLKSVFDQLMRFKSFAEPAYLKAHGAFYNDTAVMLPTDWRTSIKRIPPPKSAYEASGMYLAQFPGVQSLILLLRMYGLPLMGLEVSAHKEIAQRAGQVFIREGFCDRRYTPEGLLTPRDELGAVLKNPVEIQEQVIRLAPLVDSICLHGDTPGCLEFAEMVFKTLVDAGYGVGV
jgi:UPF0271 protein